MDKLKVNIPDKEKADLKKFISLEHEKRSLILQKLSAMPLIFPPNDFETELSESLKIENGEAHSIIQLIINIFSSTDQSKVTIVDFLHAVEDDLNFNKHEGAVFKHFFNEFKDFLEKENNNLRLLSKAYFAYLSNSENMVKDSTVFSDIKTIFDYNEKNAFFLLNRMKIEFNSQSGHQEIIFSLDDEDIENLIKSLTSLKERNLILKKGLSSIKEMPLISFRGENQS